MDFKLIQSVRVLSGAGCSSKLSSLINEAGYKKVFVVTTKGRSSLAEKLCEGLNYVIFNKVLPDPPSDIVEKGAEICKSEGCDCVLAVGGGSSIDAAKGINILRFNEGGIIDYANKPMQPCSGLIDVV